MKTKSRIALWVFIILSIALSEYYLINKYVDDDKNGKVVEDRELSKTETSFFSEYFLNNQGFVQNFYEDVVDITIPMILYKNQGVSNVKELTDDQKRDIIKKDMLSQNNYVELYSKPSSAFLVIIDAKKMEDLYLDMTGKEYQENASSDLWIYNSKHKVYYDSIPYGSEGEYPNYYKLSNIKIYDNDIYQITYTSYYKIPKDDPNYSGENAKQELHSGIIKLKKIDNKHYHFITNFITEDISYISMIKNYAKGFDFNNPVSETTKTLSSSYYNDDKNYNVNLKKYKSTNTLSSSYAIKVTPTKKTLPTEIYYFENKELVMYVKTINKLSSYYYFANEILDATYIEKTNNDFEFKAYLKSFEQDGKDIISKTDEISI